MNVPFTRIPSIIVSLLPLLCLGGCLTTGPTPYTGLHFPPTQSVDVSFQESAITGKCQGFAHLIATTAAPTTGLEIQNALQREAMEKGANHILIGMTREERGGKQPAFSFHYFGPQYPYPFPKGWMGWKFGVQEWQEVGSLLGFGLNNWGNPENRFDQSLHIQAVLLRCE